MNGCYVYAESLPINAASAGEALPGNLRMMEGLHVLSLPAGDIAFSGSVRLDPGAAESFCVKLPNRYPLYGEWRTVFEANHNDYNVEIVRFGYVDKYALGNRSQKATVALSLQDQRAVEGLVKALFSTPDIRNKTYPFYPDAKNFLGGVAFTDGWVRQDFS